MPEFTTRAGQPFDRNQLESLIKRRFFYAPSFDIYQDVKGKKDEGKRIDKRGLYDYGPPGCALQAAIVETWRRHFVLEEEMLELDCTVITPEDVFKTSGHVEKFNDWMCKDTKTGEWTRADHLVEEVLEARLNDDKVARSNPEAGDAANAKKKGKGPQKLDDAVAQEYEGILAKIDDFDGAALGEMIKNLEIRRPQTGNPVHPPIQFNLMFKSSIGPSSASPVYLRPETAQGQFLNFRNLLEFNQNAMPFASASIGKSFRNEISPRSGLLRVREFLMAEIEHYVDPEGGKKHIRFGDVKDLKVALLDKETQLSGKTTTTLMAIGDAVAKKVIDNETLGYFLGRVYLFLEKIGIDPRKLRFRQHLANEMAHYACDCWDGEIQTSHGWIECVGCADRSAYDLTVHANYTGESLAVKETRPEPLKIEEWVVTLDKKKLGPRFRGDAKVVTEAVDKLSQSAAEALGATLEKTGSINLPVTGLSTGAAHVELGPDLVTIKKQSRVEHMREYVPNVIEPSFGIGRILYSLLEHAYWHRADDVARGVLSLPLLVAPTKVLLVPLSSQPEFAPIMRTLSARLRALGIANKTDDSSASIGKRYARNDELGTPLGITVDFDTVKDGSVTLRDRDSTRQVRASQDDIVAAVERVVAGRETWAEVAKRLPAFAGPSGD